MYSLEVGGVFYNIVNCVSYFRVLSAAVKKGNSRKITSKRERISLAVSEPIKTLVYGLGRSKSAEFRKSFYFIISLS